MSIKDKPSFWYEGPSEKVRWLLFLGVGFVLPLLMLGPLFSAAYRASNSTMDSRFGSICITRLNRIGKAFEMYSADFDQSYPLAESWIDETWGYVLDSDPSELTEHTYQCPTIAKLRNGDFGYAMNEAFSGAKRSTNESAPLVFDADLVGRNAHGTPQDLSLPKRHGDHKENNALFPNLIAKPIR